MIIFICQGRELEPSLGLERFDVQGTPEADGVLVPLQKHQAWLLDASLGIEALMPSAPDPTSLAALFPHQA